MTLTTWEAGAGGAVPRSAWRNPRSPSLPTTRATTGGVMGDAADYTPDGSHGLKIPDGMRTGETDEDESVYWGDLYTIFDSLESQAKWYARMEGEEVL